MKFTETPLCINRTNCLNCRNDERFRKQMEKQYGEYICPLNIPLNVKLDELPKQLQDNYIKTKESIEMRRKQTEEIITIINELELVQDSKVHELITKLKTIMPMFRTQHTRSPSKCKHYLDKIGNVDHKCCGGKVSKVDAFSCTKHIITIVDKCQRCQDFTSNP